MSDLFVQAARERWPASVALYNSVRILACCTYPSVAGVCRCVVAASDVIHVRLCDSSRDSVRIVIKKADFMFFGLVVQQTISLEKFLQHFVRGKIKFILKMRFDTES